MKCSKCGYDLPKNGGRCRVCRKSREWEETGWRKTAETLFPRRIIKDLEDLDIEVNNEDVQHIFDERSLFLYGAAGTGKTLYAAALALEVRKWGTVYWEYPMLKPKFINCLDLLEEIRTSFDSKTVDDSGQEPLTTTQIIDKYSASSLLILDDLGVERPTDWSLSIIHIIINRRYENVRPTIITSNLGPKDLSERLDDRLASRICGMCRTVNFGNKDYRLKSP